MNTIRDAYNAWWDGIAQQGDPIRRPRLTQEAFDAGYRAASSDLPTLRDHFAAHAPAEPQSWFQPVMPEHPVRPVFPEQGEEGERSYVREFDSVMDAEEISNPELRAYVVAIQAYQPLANEWCQEAQKQRYLQWPYAWADATLKARSAQ